MGFSRTNKYLFSRIYFNPFHSISIMKTNATSTLPPRPAPFNVVVLSVDFFAKVIPFSSVYRKICTRFSLCVHFTQFRLFFFSFRCCAPSLCREIDIVGSCSKMFKTLSKKVGNQFGSSIRMNFSTHWQKGKQKAHIRRPYRSIMGHGYVSTISEVYGDRDVEGGRERGDRNRDTMKGVPSKQQFSQEEAKLWL